ncbi:EXLDI protein [Glycomyces sp. L485]|uniref:EXLDI protein n=1 Tax=Glycomyces sp. L485 TaxID=2909235 RepID=UPI001F4A915C|nr:EXLDI protein [Glycomyces sp. L485]MCH7232049.1 EXLDI protein [Glycomyces sp. L485]
MPNKTIYVSDKDLPLYARAQELAGGNLSKAITGALRRYVEAEEGRLEGYDEITVKVGVGPARKRRRQRFTGVKLGEWGRSDDKRAEIYKVYRSKSGKFVIHIERTPDWTWDTKEGGWKRHLGIGEQTWATTPEEGTLEVVGTLEELKAKIPAELYDMVAAGAEAPPVEDLDI